jgi:hypothetical protein
MLCNAELTATTSCQNGSEFARTLTLVIVKSELLDVRARIYDIVATLHGVEHWAMTGEELQVRSQRAYVI